MVVAGGAALLLAEGGMLAGAVLLPTKGAALLLVARGVLVGGIIYFSLKLTIPKDCFF